MNCLALSVAVLYLVATYSGLAETTEAKKGPKVTDKVSKAKPISTNYN